MLQARQAQKARVALHPAHQDTRAPWARAGFPGTSETGGLAVERLPAVDQLLVMQRLAPQTNWRACSLQAASVNLSLTLKPCNMSLKCRMSHEHQCVQCFGVVNMQWHNMYACPVTIDMHREIWWSLVHCLAAGMSRRAQEKHFTSTLYGSNTAARPQSSEPYSAMFWHSQAARLQARSCTTRDRLRHVLSPAQASYRM